MASTAPTWTMTKRPALPPMKGPCMPPPGPVGGAFAPFSRSAAHRSGYGASCAASATPRSIPIWWAHPSPSCKIRALSATRFAADNGIFRCYLHAMGGALATRAEHPIKLAHLIEEQANAYSEDIKHLMGLHTARLGVPTRLTGWEVVPAGTFKATKAAEGSASGAGVKTGDSPAPWSSDNNCTRPDPDAFTNQIMREQWGLSPFSIARLRAGSSVTVDDFALWLENRWVQSSRTLPREPDLQLEGLQPAKQGQLDEYDWKGIRTGRCWLRAAAKSTRHRATLAPVVG